MSRTEPREAIMWVGWVLTCLAALATVGLVAFMATSFTWPLLVGAIFMAIVTVGLAIYSDDLMGNLEGRSSVFGSTAEKELLTSKQRKELKAARGEVLMELAMLDVANEKDNIAHRALEDAGDDAKPPHKTSFTNPDGSPKQIGR